MLYGSTALPLVVAIATIGVDDGAMTAGEAAALVGVGMLSVLVLPLVAPRSRSGAKGLPAERVSGSESW
ncbi:hypothetical protein ACIO8G_14265 [Streptomyces sp. NPDC087219]|uniref:hypothetical protein n=1 Tax=Streptomyces sp. NPDC087219 TaxID=3365770 RepID=UPI0038047815